MEQSMAEHYDIPTEPVGPTTVEAFLADRVAFWSRFTRFIVVGVVAVIVVLLFLAWITL
jgi:hypothetical protein